MAPERSMSRRHPRCSISQSERSQREARTVQGERWHLLDEDMTWDIMMERYHVSHTMIAKYRKAALKELDKQYELRDRQVEAFVLG